MNQRCILAIMFLFAWAASMAANQVPPLPAASKASTLPLPPPPVVTSPAASPGDPFVNFSFDQVDIRLLVKLVGDLTGRSFVIDKIIDSKITVVSPPQIPVSEVYPLFLAILEAGGCAVVERDGIYHVVAREPRLIPVAPVMGAGEPIPRDGIITKVIHVSNLNVADLKKVLDPMVDQGKSGALGLLEATNHLIITDSADNIRRIEKIIEQIDKPGMSRGAEIVALKYAAAQDMAGELNQAITGVAAKQDTPGNRLRQRLPKPDGSPTMPSDALVIAAPHSNSLILVGTPSQVADLKRIIERMDTEPQTGHGHLKAIFLKYLSSDEAAKSLTSLLAKGVDKPQNQKISIESNLANNALLVDAAPQDFEMVRELVLQLDQPPQQVLVEVMFAELTMEKGSDIGVEFMAGGSPGADSAIALGGIKTTEGDDELATKVMSGIIPNGMTFGIAKGSYTKSDGTVVPYFPALINVNAIKNNGKFNILSNIPLLTQNNQQASVTIGKNIPILKSTVSAGAGTARDYIENIDRIDVGIKLTVTPHINPNGEVLMKLNPSIEAILEESTGGKPFTPTIAKREVTTTMTVPNNDTVVISGLIREDTVSKERKVPILGSIPLLGWLFRHNVESVERTNLLIFVTPHVATNLYEMAELSRRIQTQTSIGGTNSAPIAPSIPGEISHGP
ncbi:MAG: type II secretion system secretin GspD [Verrucomicrobia bacterium]|nr:type II secretion system secretin GspD [Verrucomicrobiota bacterium]MCG2679989.1 type II secretion system secretin GspD [Kiritimatiellia bacterium]MBU4247374.1 type II secretion system secretin GspD [Verrucomicrobiota bacterium]MBU4290623.1 type II secretion system secretin GspD [Verrucomicrobiota bacterium]MBU4429216.1 type II secretion system secretin GspD [Verrucomicrobiota bacterium]